MPLARASARRATSVVIGAGDGQHQGQQHHRQGAHGQQRGQAGLDPAAWARKRASSSGGSSTES
jgi:hypothetical protein